MGNLSKYESTMYNISEIYINFSDGTYLTIPSERIVSMDINKDFDNHIMPLINLRATVEITTFNKIMENKSSVKFNISLGSFNVNIESDEYKSGDYDTIPHNLTSVLSGDFVIFSNETSVNISTNLMEKTYATDNGESIQEGPEKFSSDLDIYLYKANSLMIDKQFNSLVFSESTLSDVILYMAKHVGINNLLMSPLDNISTYHDIITPANSFKNIIYGLQDIYGLYNTGVVLFYDYNRTYLLSKDHKITAIEKNELKYVNITIYEKGELKSSYEGSYITDNEYYINCIIEPSTSDNTQLIKEKFGDTVYSISSYNNEHETYNSSINGYDWVSPVVLDNKVGNTYIMNSYIYDVEESLNTMTISFPTANINYLTPNKVYNIKCEISNSVASEKYSGIYRLSSVEIIFKKEGSRTFRGITTCSLKKI